MVVILAVVAAIGVYVLVEVKDTLGSGYGQHTNPSAANYDPTLGVFNETLGDGMGGLSDMMSWLAIIVIVIMGAIIIKLLFDSFG